MEKWPAACFQGGIMSILNLENGDPMNLIGDEMMFSSLADCFSLIRGIVKFY